MRNRHDDEPCPSSFPSSLSLPDLHAQPLPRLSSISYLRSPQKLSRSPQLNRPQPPTPHKMMAYAEAHVDPATTRRRKRASATSAIPRPTSGTSRRTTPIGLHNASKTSSSIGATTRPSHSPCKVVNSNNCYPPTSWSTPHPRLPRSESLLPYSQRPPNRDLSGVKQQLQIRHYSTHSLPDLEAIGGNYPDSMSPRNAIPKSETTASLLSSSRGITPRRRLLRPIDPPLPRSQTIGNIASLNSNVATKSSPYRSQISSVTNSLHQMSTKVNVIDALLESRMTEDEIEVLNQVRREVATNQLRLRDTLLDKKDKARYQPNDLHPNNNSFLRKRDSVATINLSANDVANTQRLEEQRRKTLGGKPAFINSTLAHADRTGLNLPTRSAIASAADSGTEDEWETNMKLVYFAEEPPYWIGRYMTLCSTLRMKEMANRVIDFSSRLSITDAKTEGFESAETRRTNLALAELRNCCRTTRALRSFENFESGLRKAFVNSLDVYERPGSRELQKQNLSSRRGLVIGESKQLPTVAVSKKSVQASKMMNIQAGAEIQGAPNGSGRITLTKSKTTGNLATLAPQSSSKLCAPSSRTREPGELASPKHVRRTSYLECSPETRAKALKEREERAMRRAAEARRRSNLRTSSYSDTSSGANKPDHDLKKVRTPQARASVAEIAKTDASYSVKKGSTVPAIETGHSPPPPASSLPAPMTARASTEAEMVNGEIIVKSWNRPERRSSGEMVKNLFGAGIREVRRMGRRVGGSMSWTGSSEDVSVMLNGCK